VERRVKKWEGEMNSWCVEGMEEKREIGWMV
jgi:hypothetical protein